MTAIEDEKKLAKVELKFPDVDVDAAAKEIEAILRRTTFKGAKQVGEFILETFFEGKVELAQSHNPSKESSFRKLSDRCGTPELPVSKTYLNTAVGVAIMCRRLVEGGGTPTYNDLPPSHQVALLPLREPKKVEEFAKRILKEDLKVLDVKQKVQKVVAKRKTSGRGRKATPLVLRTLDRTLSRFEHESGDKPFSRAEISALSEEQKKQALKTAQELIAGLKKLEGQLRARPKRK